MRRENRLCYHSLIFCNHKNHRCQTSIKPANAKAILLKNDAGLKSVTENAVSMPSYH